MSVRADTWTVDAHHVKVLACPYPVLVASTAILNPRTLPAAIGHFPLDHELTLFVPRDVHG